MLHQNHGRGYRQTLFIPNCPPSDGNGLHVSVLGRLRGNGAFDLHQVSMRYSYHVVQSGRGHVTINGLTSTVTAGDSFVFYPQDHVHYVEDVKQPWRYTWFGIEGEQTRAQLDRLGCGEQRVHFQIANPRFWQLCDALELAFTQPSHGQLEATAAAWNLLHSLDVQQHQPQIIDPIVALASIVESGYDRGLRVEELAADLGMDRSTLFRRFRAKYGCAPQQWLMRIRLDRAYALLRKGDMTVAQVAERCGFSDARGFSRAFHGAYQQPPGAVRRGESPVSETTA